MFKIIIMLLMSCVYITYAQVKDKRIDKGGYLPQGLILKNVIYADSGRIDTKYWAGKSVIIEFGTTRCPPCMESFKRMNMLKSQYGNRLDFYMVTPQKEEVVLNDFKQRNMEYLTNVPVITQDTVLKQMFPHRGEPHVVWIDRKGRVIAVTNHHYLEKDKIEAFLNEEELDWPVKWDFPYEDNEKMLVFNPFNFREASRPKRYYYSVVTDHLEGLPAGSGTILDSIKQEKRIYVRNKTLLQLYARLFSHFYTGSLMPSQILVDPDDRDSYFYDASLGTLFDWQTKNTYSYEFIFPLETSGEDMKRSIKNQLDRFLGLQVSLQLIKRPSWVLYYVPENKRKEARGNARASSVKDLLRGLNMTPFKKPLVLSDSFDKENVEKIWYELTDEAYTMGLEAINKGLAPYGLIIKEQDHLVETLIIEKD